MSNLVAENSLAPDFTLPSDRGEAVTLSSLRGQKVVLYFYPKDDTSGCTLEALEFTALKPAFEAAGATVLAVSPDTVKSHCAFRDKHGLGITLLADEDHSAIGPYGVWAAKKMYGRSYMGVDRSTFLIDAEGRLARVWRGVSVRNHASEVLAAAQALG